MKKYFTFEQTNVSDILDSLLDKKVVEKLSEVLSEGIELGLIKIDPEYGQNVRSGSGEFYIGTAFFNIVKECPIELFGNVIDGELKIMEVQDDGSTVYSLEEGFIKDKPEDYARVFKSGWKVAY